MTCLAAVAAAHSQQKRPVYTVGPSGANAVRNGRPPAGNAIGHDLFSTIAVNSCLGRVGPLAMAAWSLANLGTALLTWAQATDRQS